MDKIYCIDLDDTICFPNHEFTETFDKYVKAKPTPTPKPGGGKKVAKDLSKFSKTIASEQQLDSLISELDSTRGELNAGNEIEINW